jgi:anti-sigma regulatory factor (Ser/Thr protein kinase)
MTSRPESRSAVSGEAGVPTPEVVALDHRFGPDDLYGLRAALAAHAGRLGVYAEHLDHLLIVASELASNAVRHGGGSGRLRLWHDGHHLHCQVIDSGPGIADGTVGTTRPSSGQVGGRGLWIVRQLCEQVEISSGTGRTVVTAVLVAPTARDRQPPW